MPSKSVWAWRWAAPMLNFGVGWRWAFNVKPVGCVLTVRLRVEIGNWSSVVQLIKSLWRYNYILLYRHLKIVQLCQGCYKALSLKRYPLGKRSRGRGSAYRVRMNKNSSCILSSMYNSVGVAGWATGRPPRAAIWSKRSGSGARSPIRMSAAECRVSTPASSRSGPCYLITRAKNSARWVTVLK